MRANKSLLPPGINPTTSIPKPHCRPAAGLDVSRKNMPRSIQVFRTSINLLAAASSVIVGFYAGIYISAIGEGSEAASLVARGAALILPLVGVAIFVDWRWLFVVVA